MFYSRFIPTLFSQLLNNRALDLVFYFPLTGLVVWSHFHFAFLLYSSLDDGANGCKTETTQIEAESSLFLEITPPEMDGNGQKLKVTFKIISCFATSLSYFSHEKKVPGSSSPKDKIPYDLSISSENNVTKGDSPEDAGAASDKDADSLHDSMEILEEVPILFLSAGRYISS